MNGTEIYLRNIYICYERQRTFVYGFEAAHVRYPDSDPYWNSIVKATCHAMIKRYKHNLIYEMI